MCRAVIGLHCISFLCEVSMFCISTLHALNLNSPAATQDQIGRERDQGVILFLAVSGTLTITSFVINVFESRRLLEMVKGVRFSREVCAQNKVEQDTELQPSAKLGLDNEVEFIEGTSSARTVSVKTFQFEQVRFVGAVRVSNEAQAVCLTHARSEDGKPWQEGPEQ
jgi:hypothetical protein